MILEKNVKLLNQNTIKVFKKMALDLLERWYNDKEKIHRRIWIKNRTWNRRINRLWNISK
jgi:hypothetical protein